MIRPSARSSAARRDGSSTTSVRQLVAASGLEALGVACTRGPSSCATAIERVARPVRRACEVTAPRRPRCRSRRGDPEMKHSRERRELGDLPVEDAVHEAAAGQDHARPGRCARGARRGSSVTVSSKTRCIAAASDSWRVRDRLVAAARRAELLDEQVREHADGRRSCSARSTRAPAGSVPSSSTVISLLSRS